MTSRREWPELAPSVRGNHNDLDPNNNSQLRVLLNEERNRAAREFSRGVEAMRRALLVAARDAGPDDPLGACENQIKAIVVTG